MDVEARNLIQKKIPTLGLLKVFVLHRGRLFQFGVHISKEGHIHGACLCCRENQGTHLLEGVEHDH
eukprot:scaffold15_cov204-Amphora_coffeaeformis.AAC.9